MSQRGMTTQALMEASDETLLLWFGNLEAEMKRRHLRGAVIEIHAGNEKDGGPTPLLVRVFQQAATLPPGDLAKVEALIIGLAKPKATAP